MKLTPLSKMILVLCVLAAGFFAVRQLAPGLLDRVMPSKKGRASSVPPRADLPGLPGTSTAAGRPAAPHPTSTRAGCTDRPEVRMYIWAWNAQMGLLYATGGPQSTEGSLMCAKGVNLRLIREDMVDRMQEGLVSFAVDLSRGNSNPTNGVQFVSIMGDGAAAFLRGVSEALAKLGPEYTTKVVGSCGYSRGEDKFMGPAAWKSNPAASRGGVVAGVLRDGDWNIAQKWLGDNGLSNNPDETTWDPDALNWVNASDYIDASEKYIAGYSEERPVVRNGRKTGEKHRITVEAVVTWTPGDVIVAEKKGGLVSIVSTREYSSQMPNVIIGIDKWMKQNRSIVEGMIESIGEAGDAIRSDPSALRRAAEISTAVYSEAGTDAAYWEKYYLGTVEPDHTGLRVELGGSSVNNLADMQLTFGLTAGASNLFAATYKVFGDIVVAQYPDLVPTYPPVEQILDTSYLAAVSKRTTARLPAERPTFVPGQQMGSVVSRRAWEINFETGSTAFTPAAERELQKLLRDLLVAGATVVEVHGHTDNVGNPESNLQLSEGRAFAVKAWLERQSPLNFPEGRVRIFPHGQMNPVAPNTTVEGRARNRRVEIVLGTAASAGN